MQRAVPMDALRFGDSDPIRVGARPDPLTMAEHACPICGGPSRRIFVVRGYPIRSCRHCDHRYAEVTPSADHPQAVYGDAYFHDGGAGYPSYLDQGPIIRATGRHYAGLVARDMPPGRVLDAGAAAGFILKSFVDAGWKGIGVEPNASMAEYGRTELGLDVRTGSLETFTTQEPVDLVTMIQVLPHLWDVRRGLASAAAATKPGGYWLIETWDRSSLTARVFGQRWHEYSPPSVLHWFDREGVTRLAARYGLREVRHGRRLKWVSRKHAASLLRHTLADDRPGVVARAVDALERVLPARLPYPSEDLFWVLLRKDHDGTTG
jgi:SAM-dependent methyltransferase